MSFLFAIFTMFLSPHLWADTSIDVDNITNENLRFSSDSAVSFYDRKGHRYAILCEKYMRRESVQLFLVAHRLHAILPNCQKTLDQLRSHLEIGHSLDSMKINLFYKEGTKQAQVDIQFKFLEQTVRLEN